MHILSEGLLWYLAFLFSVVVHEASHAFTAMKLGDKTAYERPYASSFYPPAVVLFQLMVKMSSYLLNGFNQKQGESWQWTSSNPIHADHSL
jgi:hypothetical protein